MGAPGRRYFRVAFPSRTTSTSSCEEWTRGRGRGGRGGGRREEGRSGAGLTAQGGGEADTGMSGPASTQPTQARAGERAGGRGVPLPFRRAPSSEHSVQLDAQEDSEWPSDGGRVSQRHAAEGTRVGAGWMPSLSAVSAAARTWACVWMLVFEPGAYVCSQTSTSFCAWCTAPAMVTCTKPSIPKFSACAHRERGKE